MKVIRMTFVYQANKYISRMVPLDKSLQLINTTLKLLPYTRNNIHNGQQR